MSRIAERFAELKKKHRKALVPYVTAGDPQPGTTVPVLHAMSALDCLTCRFPALRAAIL